jgi:hypothetical protein
MSAITKLPPADRPCRHCDRLAEPGQGVCRFHGGRRVQRPTGQCEWCARSAVEGLTHCLAHLTRAERKDLGLS